MLHISVYLRDRKIGHVRATEDQVRERMTRDGLPYRLTRLDRNWSAELVIYGLPTAKSHHKKSKQ